MTVFPSDVAQRRSDFITFLKKKIFSSFPKSSRGFSEAINLYLDFSGACQVNCDRFQNRISKSLWMVSFLSFFLLPLRPLRLCLCVFFFSFYFFFIFFFCNFVSFSFSCFSSTSPLFSFFFSFYFFFCCFCIFV